MIYIIHNIYIIYNIYICIECVYTHHIFICKFFSYFFPTMLSLIHTCVISYTRVSLRTRSRYVHDTEVAQIVVQILITSFFSFFRFSHIFFPFPCFRFVPFRFSSCHDNRNANIVVPTKDGDGILFSQSPSREKKEKKNNERISFSSREMRSINIIIFIIFFPFVFFLFLPENNRNDTHAFTQSRSNLARPVRHESSREQLQRSPERGFPCRTACGGLEVRLLRTLAFGSQKFADVRPVSFFQRFPNTEMRQIHRQTRDLFEA